MPLIRWPDGSVSQVAFEDEADDGTELVPPNFIIRIIKKIKDLF